MPTISNASPYFFYLTCEFSLHCERHVLVHLLLLMSCFAYLLFVLCHPSRLLNMAPVSKALHVSYMRSLCKKDCRTGHRVILWAMRHGVAEKFVQFCAGLRVIKRSCITLDHICKAVARKLWPRCRTNFSNEAYHVWLGMRRMALPQSAVPSGDSAIVVLRAHGRMVVHASLTRPSRMSNEDHGALQLRKLWRSIVRRCIVVWVDNWWHAQIRANPVKPNVCRDVTARALLQTTPLPLFLRPPSLQDLVDWFDTGALTVVA